MSRMVWSKMDVDDALAKHKAETSGAKKQLSMSQFMRPNRNAQEGGGDEMQDETTTTTQSPLLPHGAKKVVGAGRDAEEFAAEFRRAEELHYGSSRASLVQSGRMRSGGGGSGVAAASGGGTISGPSPASSSKPTTANTSAGGGSKGSASAASFFNRFPATAGGSSSNGRSDRPQLELQEPQPPSRPAPIVVPASVLARVPSLTSPLQTSSPSAPAQIVIGKKAPVPSVGSVVTSPVAPPLPMKRPMPVPVVKSSITTPAPALQRSTGGCNTFFGVTSTTVTTPVANPASAETNPTTASSSSSVLRDLLQRHEDKNGKQGGATSAAIRGGGGGGAPAMPDDQVMWGPSGGGNRETQGRRGPRRFMNGKEQAAVFEASPYSKNFIGAWREQLRGSGEGDQQQKQKGSSFKKEEPTGVKSEAHNSEQPPPPPQQQAASTNNTEFASADLLQPFQCDNCPRNLFAGCVFFLNSCDSDPQISVYLLEKLIRYLGGVTTMGISATTSYVVTQHLCSAKESKIQQKPLSKFVGGGGGSGGGKSSSATKYVHPHFVLACAKAGKVVSWTDFSTITSTKTGGNSATAAQKSEPVKLFQPPSANGVAGTNTATKKMPPTAASATVVCLSSDDDDDDEVTVLANKRMRQEGGQ